MLIDNCSAHKKDIPIYSNIKLLLFPPNMTSVLQPLDQGIIAWVKCRFRHFQMSFELNSKFNNPGQSKPYHMPLELAMREILRLWNIIPRQVIRNCFRHTGLWAEDKLPKLGLQEHVDPDASALYEQMREILQSTGISMDAKQVKDWVHSEDRLPRNGLLREDWTVQDLVESTREKRPSFKQQMQHKISHFERFEILCCLTPRRTCRV